MGSRPLLWYLLVGTRGGANRLRIVEMLKESPRNAHELASDLGLDYRTVRHHLGLLESAGAVARPLGAVYASPYELTAHLIANLRALQPLRRARDDRSSASRPAPNVHLG